MGNLHTVRPVGRLERHQVPCIVGHVQPGPISRERRARSGAAREVVRRPGQLQRWLRSSAVANRPHPSRRRPGFPQRDVDGSIRPDCRRVRAGAICRPPCAGHQSARAVPLHPGRQGQRLRHPCARVPLEQPHGPHVGHEHQPPIRRELRRKRHAVELRGPQHPAIPVERMHAPLIRQVESPVGIDRGRGHDGHHPYLRLAPEQVPAGTVQRPQVAARLRRGDIYPSRAVDGRAEVHRPRELPHLYRAVRPVYPRAT